MKRVRRRSRCRLSIVRQPCGIAAFPTLTAMVAACGGPATSTPPTSTPAAVPSRVPRATVTGPVRGGKGIDLVGTTSFDLRAAVVALNNWVITGLPPPQSPRLDVASATSFATDENGEAVGGVRTPQVAAPIAVVNGTGDTSNAGGGFCGIFGTTIPFSSEKLAQLYPTHAAFVTKWSQAVASDVSKGYLLPADATVLDRVAGQSTIGG